MFLLAVLISQDQCFAGAVVKLNGATRTQLKVRGLELFAIDECQRKAVGEDGAELFHQVQSKSGAARPHGVEIHALPRRFQKVNRVSSRLVFNANLHGKIAEWSPCPAFLWKTQQEHE